MRTVLGMTSIGQLRGSGVVSHDGFSLQVLVEAQRAPFSAVARPAVAAERRVEVRADAVEGDVAGANAPRHRPGPLIVARDVAGPAGHAVVSRWPRVIRILLVD